MGVHLMFDLIENWGSINFLVYLGVLLFVAKLIKEKVPFLNKIILPSALIAGFIGLILSDGFLNVIPLGEDGTRNEIIYNIVYHALAIGFISLTLKRDENKTTKKVWSTGMIIVSTYLLQAIIGAALVYFFFKTYFLELVYCCHLGLGKVQDWLL